MLRLLRSLRTSDSFNCDLEVLHFVLINESLIEVLLLPITILSKFYLQDHQHASQALVAFSKVVALVFHADGDRDRPMSFSIPN